MMRILLTLSTLLALAACGADGPPTPPVAQPAVSITGEANVGVSAQL